MIKVAIFLFTVLTPSLLISQNTNAFTYQFNGKISKQNPNYELIENMTLVTQGEKSIFTSPRNIIKDSIIQSLKKNGDDYLGELQNQMSKYPKNRLNYYLIQNNGQFTYVEKVFYLELAYKENPEFNWKIIEQYKTILGYKCQLATTEYEGRKYSAWFSLDIPIPMGPYKFRGLPGLIMEISDTENIFQFTIVELKSQGVQYPAIKPKNTVTYTDMKNLNNSRINVLFKALERAPSSIEKVLPRYKRLINDEVVMEVLRQ